MAKHRVHSIAFKRQLVAECAAGETLHTLVKPAEAQGRRIPLLWS